MRFASSFSRSPGSSASSSHRVSSVTVAGTWRGLTAVFLRRVMRLVGWKHCPRCAAALENDGRAATCGECGFTAYAGPEPTVSASRVRRRRPDPARTTQVRARGGEVGSSRRLPGRGRRATRRVTARAARGGRRRDRAARVRGRLGRPLRRRRGRLGHAQPLLARSALPRASRLPRTMSPSSAGSPSTTFRPTRRLPSRTS